MYAPVDRYFFSSHETTEFDNLATHLVLGDANTPLDPRLDSSASGLSYERGRSCCLDWLAWLNVVDARQINYDSKRVFTRSLSQKNRLDYIFLSKDFYAHFYDDFKYFLPKHVGDHLARM